MSSELADPGLVVVTCSRDFDVAILPGLAVHVHDAYVAGECILHPALAGALTLMNLRGSGFVAQGELMRFFAEAAW